MDVAAQDLSAWDDEALVRAFNYAMQTHRKPGDPPVCSVGIGCTPPVESMAPPAPAEQPTPMAPPPPAQLPVPQLPGLAGGDEALNDLLLAWYYRFNYYLSP